MTEQWIIAIGTGILAFIALFQDFFRSWLKTPKLDISTGSFYPICKKLLFEDKDNPNNIAEGYALRIVVKNTKPFFRVRCRAEQVEVYAAKLSRKGKDGMFHTIQEFEPTRLIWSHSFIALDNISPKMERYCFIGRMLKPVERDHFPAFYHEKIPPHETCLRIDTEIPRNTKEHIIGRENYFLECLIGAANTKAKKVKIEINISGQWFDNEEEMFQKGFNIQVQDDP